MKLDFHTALSRAVDIFWSCVVALVVMTALTMLWLGVWCVFQKARSSGKIDYCYTGQVLDAAGKHTSIYGHRAWTTDLYLGQVDDPWEAVELIDRMGCSIQK